MQSPKNLSVGFLFDDTLDSNDGVAQYVKNLGDWLSQNGHRVSYLVGDSKTAKWKGGKVYPLAKNLRLPWAGNRLSISLLPKLKEMNAVLDNNHLDVLHVQVPYSPFMSQIMINKADDSIALVGTFHVYPANKLGFFGSRLLRVVYGKSLKRFDCWLSVSPAAASYAKRAFGISSKVSSNVVLLQEFKKSVQTPQKNHIVFLGRLVSRKGCLELLRAFKLLKSKLPKAKLTIAGDGPHRTKLENFVRVNNLADSVTFLGMIAEKDKADILASAAVACFPSRYGESFGIVLIEAMAAGAGVVIGGENPGYISVLGERPEVLVDPDKTKYFAETLYKFLTDDEAAKEVHDWQQRLVEKFDIEVVGPQVVDIYQQTIAKRSQKRHN